MIFLTVEQILFLHARLIDETGGSHDVRDLGLLLSATGGSQASFEGQDLYLDPLSKAAALLDSLIRNHPFIDGNKRTGMAAASLFLLRNDFHLTATNPELEELAMAVAQSKMTMDDITLWLREHAVFME